MSRDRIIRVIVAFLIILSISLIIYSIVKYNFQRLLSAISLLVAMLAIMITYKNKK
ncbi:hypothetical protein [Defluviitalea phaphyphila]|uniref:hypothetical protein n=1 Tax=Defluviitalea phaphyphila TaxID=1473580 RepID=UPI001366095D|nr:hypothetical protein [Defluviitalea phaphyphila]